VQTTDTTARPLDGQVAVVAGAGRGIGRAVAVAFAAAGARLVLAARTESELRETAAACEEHGASAEVVVADVASAADVDALVAATVERFGPPDVGVNAAGVYGPIGPALDVDAKAWAQALTINLVGTFHFCRAVARPMAERRKGKIVVLAGGGATAPLPSFSSYAASKAGVVRLVETLAEELADANVHVNAVAPGLVDTRLQDDVLAAGDRAGPLLEKIRAARETGAGAVRPEVAAELALFLASADSGTLTGKLISAPHDPWRDWAGRGDELNASPLYTLRRLDPYTLRPLLDRME
jgi:3-oxoacyl-[acyl-carrier protein] reductase